MPLKNPSQYCLRRAETKDLSKLSGFFASTPRMHRHLDWHPPIDWLGSQPFWLVESEQRIVAALALPPDPPRVAWVRVFACSPLVNPIEFWDVLFEKCLEDLGTQPETIIPSLVLSDWYLALLRHSGFEHYQNIVGLEREIRAEEKEYQANPDLFIRLMDVDDLDAVAEIDQGAFEPIWQNSRLQVQESFEQAALATVAELGDQIVGYQISTVNMFSAHLARLAVKPGATQRHIGSDILLDLFKRCKSERLWQITVNTQNTNSASLNLYKKTGFRETGEEFPVFIFQQFA